MLGAAGTIGWTIMIPILLLSGLACMGAFLEYSKSYGLKICIPGILISIFILFLPLLNFGNMDVKGMQIQALLVLLLSFFCIFRNFRQKKRLVVLAINILLMIYVWSRWGADRSMFYSGPDGIAKYIALAFTLGGASLLSFFLFIHSFNKNTASPET
jgi:hypothetical protein